MLWKNFGVTRHGKRGVLRLRRDRVPHRLQLPQGARAAHRGGGDVRRSGTTSARATSPETFGPFLLGDARVREVFMAPRRPARRRLLAGPQGAHPGRPRARRIPHDQDKRFRRHRQSAAEAAESGHLRPERPDGSEGRLRAGQLRGHRWRCPSRCGCSSSSSARARERGGRGLPALSDAYNHFLEIVLNNADLQLHQQRAAQPDARAERAHAGHLRHADVAVRACLPRRVQGACRPPSSAAGTRGTTTCANGAGATTSQRPAGAAARRGRRLPELPPASRSGKSAARPSSA